MNLKLVIVRADTWLSAFRGFWRFAKIRETRIKKAQTITIELSPIRMIYSAVAMAIAAYLIGAVSLYAWRLQVPHNHMGFGDIVIAPFTLERISRLQGMTNIDQSRDDLENGEIRDAFYKLRAGVARVPDDFEARLELAKFYIAAGFLTESINLLIGGLDHGLPEDARYLQTLLAISHYTENFPALMRAIPALLQYPKINENPAVRTALYQLLLRAQLEEQDYAGVIQSSEQLNQENLSKTFYDTALLSLIKIGAYADAEAYLENLPERERNDSDIKLLAAILAYSEGDRPEGRALFQALFRDDASSWRNQVDAILYLYDEGDDRSAEALLQLFLAIHRRNPVALDGIAQRFTDLPDPERVGLIVNRVVADTPVLEIPMRFYLVQSLITQGDFLAAQLEMGKIDRSILADESSEMLVHAFELIIEAAVARSAGETTELRIFFQENRLPSEVYWEAGEAMRKVAVFSTAEVLLNEGLTHYPESRPLSQLRNFVIQQEIQFEDRGIEAVASVVNTGYRAQRISSTEAIANRLVGHQPAVARPESFYNEEQYQGIEITQRDFNRTPDAPDVP